ncbi:acyltransferase [Sphingomonas metalli]|uniref:Acyltransferase n=1 Tax=Sphingomonas metalli TaxID=1779358 RepID=A0A916TG11_9SPHN|nr:acyltransferase [Sphingomonas metalli]GGB43865.1 acyltransferase [Sphingomonas metalli]
MSIGLAWSFATFCALGLVRAGFPIPNAQSRIGCVDGLRGYLALSVLIYHFILWIEVTRLGGEWSRPRLTFLDSLGPGAVNLFFMTTGFVFYPRILQGITGVNWTVVYISRLFRIVPLVAMSIILISLVVLIRLNFQVRAPWSETLANMGRWIVCWDEPALFGYAESASLNAGVLWSLWYEWLFYIFVLPLCAAAMTLRPTFAPTWTVPLGMITLALLLRPLSLFTLISYLPMFGVGMIAYEVAARPALAQRLRGSSASLVAMTCLVLGAVVFGGSLRLACHALFFVCVACGNSLWKLLQTSSARALGELSYGVYLMHGLVLSILFVDVAAYLSAIPAAMMLIVVLPAAVALAILLTLATFLMIERPFIALGKRFATSFLASRAKPMAKLAS